MARRRTIKDDGPDPIDKFVGSRVRARRVGLRISQTKLGDAIGVTFQQVQKYENGTNRIGASNLFKISKTLSVEVAFFFEGLDADEEAAKELAGLSEGSQTKFDVDPMSSREAIELMHNYFRVKDENIRKKLSQLVKTMAQTNN
ncbi:MAG: helix-turn-helix domain-containing protein [Rhodospirillales bacterium]